MRYLGRVYKQVDSKENPHVTLVLERVILVKCLKHLFRELMRETSPVFLTQQIAHALNCVFASPKHINLLNTGDI